MQFLNYIANRSNVSVCVYLYGVIMSEFDMSLDNAVFTYVIYPKKISELSRSICIEKYNLYLSYSKHTDVIYYEDVHNAIYIIGLCVDSHAEIERCDVPKFLLSVKDVSINSILRYSGRLAGNYVVIADIDDFLYAFTDATSCMQINYSLDELCFSSFDNITAKVCNASIDEKTLRIREGANYVEAMSNDVTIYKNIKLLLPNHYLSVLDMRITRYYPLTEWQPIKDIDRLLRRQLSLIDNIVKEYAKYFPLICPLTAGWDSRVVFSFLIKNYPNTSAYTFFHKHFTEETADIDIPQRICVLRHTQYFKVTDLLPDEKFYSSIYEIIGKHFYKSDIAMAYTYRKNFTGFATISGNIIDHIGKSSLVNLLPLWCATSSYFVAKDRNVSAEAMHEVKKYIDSIKANPITKPYIYDLFGWEEQCGRWCSYSQKIYAAAGITLLNIFNCREIIEGWVQIPRYERKRYRIHKYFLDNYAFDLSCMPLNPDEKLKFIHKSAFLFFIGTYINHYFIKLLKPHVKKILTVER